MYFETGQGAALSSDAHHGIDRQTVETRAYAVAREALRLGLTGVSLKEAAPDPALARETRPGLETDRP